MNKFLFWLAIIIISISFPNITLAQDSGNLDRPKIIDRQMDCVEGHSGGNNGIGWNDVCDLAQSPSNTADPATESNDNKNWEYSQSIKYSRGKYGTSQESETYEEDSVLQRDFENADVSITIPSLWQTGNVTATNTSREIVKKKTVTTTSNTTINPTIAGLGDIAFNANYYLLEEDKNAPLDVTLTGYLKAPTASSREGLGTGQLDGGPGLGFTKKLMFNFKAIADASFAFIGRVPGQDTKDQLSLDAGLEYDFNPQTTATVKYEYSNATSKGTAQSEDMALSLDYKLNDDWKLNGEATIGLSNGSPEETFLLGATVLFDGSVLGGLFSSKSEPSSLMDYDTASSPFAPISARIISDPLYLPLKSQLYGSTSYTYSLSSSSSYNYLGHKTANSSTDANTFTQATEYGITDRFAIRLSDSYSFNKAFKALTTTGANTTSNNEGFNNPTIGTTYRMIDQSNSPADIDLTLNISPNAFKDKEAGGGHDGTVASGNQPITFTTGIGREMKAFSILGTFSTIFEGNRYYEALSNDDNYYEHQYFNYEFAINTQTRLTDRLSFNLGSGYTIADKAHVTNLSTGTKFLATLADTLDFTAAINYHIIPNRLVGGITYTYDGYSNGKSTYATASSDTETKNHYANVIGARLQYLF